MTLRSSGSFALAVLLLGAAAPAWAAWSHAERIGDAPRYVRYISERPHQIAVSGETVHAVWFVAVGEMEQARALWYLRSVDCGDTWGEPVLLAEIGTGTPNEIGLAVSGEAVHVAWREAVNEDRARYSTHYTRSLDDGDTWEQKRRLSLPGQIGGFSPVLAAANGPNVYLVWKARWQRHSRIVAAVSANFGDTWEFGVPGSIRAREVSWPAFALTKGAGGNSDRLDLAYVKFPERRKKIYFRSGTEGSLWTPGSRPIKVNAPKTGPNESDLVWPVAVVPRGGTADLVWAHGIAFKYGYYSHDLYYQRRDRGGWSGKRRINNRKSLNAWFPAVAVSGETVHVAWQTRGEVWVAASADRGESWSRRRFEVEHPTTVSLAASPDQAGRCAGTRHLLYGTSDEEGGGLLYRRSPAVLGD